MLQRGAPNVRIVVIRLAAERRVDHQRDFGVDHSIDDVGPLVLVHFPNELRTNAVLLEELARS